MSTTATTSPATPTATNGNAARPPYRGCPTPRPISGLCRRPLEPGQDACHEHEGADAERRCAAMIRAGQGKPRERCAAWPLIGLPFCGAHDPARVEYRRLERLSVHARLAQVRHLIASATPEIRAQALELLVMAGTVTPLDLETVLRRYRMPSSWPTLAPPK